MLMLHGKPLYEISFPKFDPFQLRAIHRPKGNMNMRNCILGIALMLAQGMIPLSVQGEEALREEFLTPPAKARPHTFWYWMNGRISREGITADLEAMQRAGIGGAVIFNIGGHGGSGWVKVLSPEWRELMQHAIREAGRLGIEITLNNSMAGWSSSGGPWIKPELGMQKITWSETEVQGGTLFDGVLSPPPTNLDYYRDVAVLAFPTPASERTPDPVPILTASDPKFNPAKLVVGKSVSVGGRNWDAPQAATVSEAVLAPVAKGQERFIRMEYTERFAPRSLHLAFGDSGVRGTFQTSSDGTNWRDVQAFTPRTRAPVDLAFAVEPARHWRVVFAEGGSLSLTALHLSARSRIGEWTGKAMFDPFGIDKPSFSGIVASDTDLIRRDQILDLTDKLDASGRLRWEVPAGDWTILRFGHTPTGSQVGPADEGGRGLECDKLNPAALETHFKHSLQPWFDDKELNPLIQYVHVDSYERGAQNWTARFPEEFKQRRRYDLRSFLPVLTGRVVDSVEESERFLWDFRNTVTSLMHENYFGRMQQLCKEAGKRLSCEPYHQTQFNNVSAGGLVDIPMCESWHGEAPAGPYWHKLGASPAHVYGKNIVGCEAFTANTRFGGDWSTDFWDMKPFGDAMFAGGVNRMYFHVYTHQPWMNAAPGQTLAVFGTHFERTNTWWEQMPAFTDYISRCQHLLQQGRFVADVLYSSGENSPNESLGPTGAMALPSGYDYDVCDANVILNRLRVEGGKLVLPEGGSYRLLVLPEDTAMTPAMVSRIGNLVQAGAVVVAPKPTHSPSLTDQPQSDSQVRELAEAIWGNCDGKKATVRSYGQGRLFWGMPISQVLSLCGIQPDVETPTGKPLVRYIHRQLKEGEFYFLASSSLQAQAMDVVFRTAEGTPQLWDPIRGRIRPLPQFRRENGRTILSLQFAPQESYFVVFRKEGQKEAKNLELKTRNFAEVKPVQELSGPWEVQFDPKWGGPEKPVTFEKLEDWTHRPESGIKYYSGTATYRKSFEMPGDVQGLTLYLDLGKIKNVAQVRLNGQALGIVWCAPWRVEITSAVKPTDNQLEIDVVNLWPNRMIGDEQLPADCEWGTGDWVLLKRLPDWFVKGEPRTSGRYTFMTHKPWTKDSPLLESGLLGPVTILKAE